MDARQRVRDFLKRFYENRPKDFFKELDDSKRGMYMVMHMLDGADGDTAAGDIANGLGISTPRVAAALNALEKKGYVTRKTLETDRRRINVKLTDSGRREIARCDKEIFDNVEYLFDTVGEKDMNEFIRIASAINKALVIKNGERAAGGTDNKT